MEGSEQNSTREKYDRVVEVRSGEEEGGSPMLHCGDHLRHPSRSDLTLSSEMDSHATECGRTLIESQRVWQKRRQTWMETWWTIMTRGGSSQVITSVTFTFCPFLFVQCRLQHWTPFPSPPSTYFEIVS